MVGGRIRRGSEDRALREGPNQSAQNMFFGRRKELLILQIGGETFETSGKP